jgi:hypothetical protein
LDIDFLGVKEEGYILMRFSCGFNGDTMSHPPLQFVWENIHYPVDVVWEAANLSIRIFFLTHQTSDNFMLFRCGHFHSR